MDYGKLYLVATPIGNLDDMTCRAAETLKNSDIIACEDTRHSLHLLNHLGISKPLTSYFEHNKRQKGEYLVSLLKEGKNISLVTDAGTPAISDPGEDLVKMCIAEGIQVVPVPGAVAFVNALIISGMDTGRFCFEGFLSVNKKSRREHLLSLKDERRTMIFHEAPHKLKNTLADFLENFGNRRISLVKELTKVHEKCFATTLEDAVKYFENEPPKGEYVLVLEGKSDKEAADEAAEKFTEMSVCEHVDMLIGEGMDKKEAVKEVAAQRGLPKREVYNEYVRK